MKKNKKRSRKRHIATPPVYIETRHHLSVTIPLLIFFLVLFGLSFLFPSSPTSTLTTLLLRAKQNPFETEAHALLARTYLDMHHVSQAKNEMTIATDLLKDSLGAQVLGTTSEYPKVQKFLTEEPERVKKAMDYWEKIAAQYPAYRDAWVQLVYISYNQGNFEKARQYLEKIAALDPNYADLLRSQLHL